MKAITLYEEGHQWVVFCRDDQKKERIIDTNQYMVVSGERAFMMDPGGIELFAPMLGSALNYVRIDQITDLFSSHQDPDVCSSLGLWDKALPKARLHAPWLWEGFLRHFGMERIEYMPIEDQGGTLTLGSLTLKFIPAHYLHSSGNFHVYDPVARILMSGDVGASLEPEGAPLFVEDFDDQVTRMELFHRRWMPSNEAKNDWIRRVRQLEIDIMAPQHGRIFKGQDVVRFLDWFEALDVGMAIGG